MKVTIPVFIVLSILIMIASISYTADNTSVSFTATVISNSKCTFNTKTASLNFGNLDAANPTDKTVSTSITFRCQENSNNPITYFISDDDGLNETGPNANRMRNTTIATEYLPYSFTLNPTSGTTPKNTNQTLTISGTVRGVDYQDAYVGSYADTVAISIVP